jgi:hypothetical protein
MTPVVLLRIAAILAAIQGFAHGALFTSAKPRYGAEEVAVIEAMKMHRFFAGATRSYWDLYFGYGLIAAGVCLVEAVLLWQLSRITAASPALARPMIALLLAANVAHLILVGRYFMFLVPMAFDVLIAALLTWAYIAIVVANR